MWQVGQKELDSASLGASGPRCQLPHPATHQPAMPCCLVRVARPLRFPPAKQVVTNVTASELTRRLDKEGVIVASFFAGGQSKRGESHWRGAVCSGAVALLQGGAVLTAAIAPLAHVQGRRARAARG